MPRLRLFLDSHDAQNKTFPAQISQEQFARFFAAYADACQAEGVILLQTHVGYADGRAFCLTMAPEPEAVYRAHQRVGLPFDTLTEVETASPADTFFLASLQPSSPTPVPPSPERA